MKPDKLIDQLELYANAIVGFVVAQSIAFSLSFGTDVAFGCEVTRWKALSAALILHFVLSTAAGVWALRAMAERVCALSAEAGGTPSALVLGTVRFAAKAKSAVLVLFTLVPIGLLLFFGLLAQPDTGRCAKAPPAAPQAPAQAAVPAPAPAPAVVPSAPS